ncbi:hypothetical protein V6N13_110096 [Hibiscus sabdariffa]
MELLTGKMALSFDGLEEERNLTNYFLKSMKDGHLFQIVDEILLAKRAGDIEQIKQVAKRCLRVKSDERPTMKEVAIEARARGSKSETPTSMG